MDELNNFICRMLDEEDGIDAQKVYQQGFQLFDVVQLKMIWLTKTLIQLGCPINAQDPRDGYSALHRAVKMDDPRHVKLLLAFGADVDIENNYCRTPMYYLRNDMDGRNSCKILKLLLKAGASFDLDDDDSAASKILMHGSRRAVEISLQYVPEIVPDIEETEHLDDSPLWHLAHNKNKGVIELLQNLDFDVNIRSLFNDASCLHIAASEGNTECVRFFLGKGADPNCESKEGDTPLLWVSRNIWSLKHGPNKNKRRSERKKVVRLLLENGANIDKLLLDREEVERFIQMNAHELIEPVLEQLAIIEAKGVANQSCYENIRTYAKLNRYYDSCKQEIEGMICLKIKGNVSFFNILVESVDKVSKYLRGQDVVDFVTSFNIDVEFPRYAVLLKSRLEEAMKRRNLMQFIRKILCNWLQLCDPDHIVIEKIISYLTIEDLRRLYCKFILSY